jgi:hypothetical protein
MSTTFWRKELYQMVHRPVEPAGLIGIWKSWKFTPMCDLFGVSALKLLRIAVSPLTVGPCKDVRQIAKKQRWQCKKYKYKNVENQNADGK